MVRKTNRMTIEDLALEMRAGFAEQKKFNEKQEVFNAKQITFNEEIIKRLDRIERCPTIKKELAKLQK